MQEPLARGQEAVCVWVFWVFESFLVQQFKLSGEIREFEVPGSLLRDWLQISCGVVRRLYCMYFVLHIHYYYYH